MIQYTLFVDIGEEKPIEEFCAINGLMLETEGIAADFDDPSFGDLALTLHLPDGTQVCESVWAIVLEELEDTGRSDMRDDLECLLHLLKEEQLGKELWPLVAATFFKLPNGAVFAIDEEDGFHIVKAGTVNKICDASDWEPIADWQGDLEES